METRLKKILERMTAPGSFPNMSCSEGHELVESVYKMEECLRSAEKMCKKFVDKVETGRARSKETYKDCKEVLRSIRMLEEGITEEDIHDTMPDQ
jgi:hypothetical protein